jgi:hypothetical protein
MATHMTDWIAAVEARHLADLRFAEVARAIRALSSSYVERRSRLGRGSALDGAGKRAAFALYYAPLHLLTVQRIVQALHPLPVGTILDLGCGTGAAGCAWALAQAASGEPPPRLHGIDRHPWAVAETRWTYKALDLPGRAEQRELDRASFPGKGSGVVAAYTMNEASEDVRLTLLRRYLQGGANGVRILIVEPIAHRVTPWWRNWRRAFEDAGGRAHEWRFEADVPESVRRLGRAAGLDTRELTARSLWL